MCGRLHIYILAKNEHSRIPWIIHCQIQSEPEIKIDVLQVFMHICLQQVIKKSMFLRKFRICVTFLYDQMEKQTFELEMFETIFQKHDNVGSTFLACLTQLIAF